MEKYDASSIKIIKGLDSVKKRPGMYIGNTDDGSGLHNMLWEVFSNSLDLFMINKCSEITVILHSDNSVEVIDDGYGLPIHNIDGKTFVERIMTELHFTATYDGHAPHTHVGGIHGVGISVVNALSSYVDINIYSKGEHYQQKFSYSKPKPMKEIGKTNNSGTSIRFLPDIAFFSNIVIYNEGIIHQRLQEICYLNKNIIINFTRKNLKTETYICKNGLISYLSKIKQINSEIIAITDEYNGIKVDIAFAWSDKKGHIQSFANNLSTTEGGTHVKGLIKGLSQMIKESGRHEIITKYTETEIKKNLIAIIHVNIADPKFGSPCRDKLMNNTVYKAVKTIVYKATKNSFFK